MTKRRIEKLVASGNHEAFCTLWHPARAVLESLTLATSNVFVKIAISATIAFGNKLYKNICK